MVPSESLGAVSRVSTGALVLRRVSVSDRSSSVSATSGEAGGGGEAGKRTMDGVPRLRVGDGAVRPPIMADKKRQKGEDK